MYLETFVTRTYSGLLIDACVIAFNIAVSEVHTTGNFRAQGNAATYALLLVFIRAGVLQAGDVEISTDLCADLWGGDDCTF
jgi:hypothetical protein